ncbi:MAG: CHAT domain-containing protein [Pseudolabrys sp.]|nr:CHAT domain-containing protein [Pseudolabrys sp.]
MSLPQGVRLAVPVIVALALIAGASNAFAQSHDAIVENCKQTVGRPIVQACMGGGRNDAMREPCREKARPQVRACVIAAEQKIAAGKAAPAAAPKLDTGPVDISQVQTVFVAPPRTIADITAILDQEKPDEAKIAKARAAADMPPPAGADNKKLAQFYYDRGNARSFLARNQDALADANKALEVGKGSVELRQVSRLRQLIVIQYQQLGDPKQAMAVLQDVIRDSDQPGVRGSLINSSRTMAQVLVSMGDVSQADAFARRTISRVSEARGSPNPVWRESYQKYGNSWESDADTAKALVLEARGQYKESEAAYVRAEGFRRAAVKDVPKMDFPPPVTQVITAADHLLVSIGRVKAKQGRLSEAEADTRKALLSVLKNLGKYHASTPTFVVALASILVEQGRYPEAEQLARSALDIQHTLGIADDSPTSATILAQLGGVLTLQRKDKEAIAVYAQLEQAIAKWDEPRRDVFLLSGSRITALYAAGRVQDGIALAQTLVKKQAARTGENHFDTAAARGTLGIGYARAGRYAEAIKEFKAAIPVMMTASRENAEDDDTTVIAARSQSLQGAVEAYIGALARTASKESATETFALADSVRGHSVQQALAASSARMIANDPALAELVRTEQDLGKQISAQLGTLNNILALPSSERDEKGVRAINAAIEKLRTDRVKARQDISRRFPSYADLVDPKPPSVEQIKAALRPGEALLSFYFGKDASFVWAVPKEGAIAFAEVPATALDIEAKVRKLREALEPQALMISDIPPFDLALASELYGLLLKPIEGGWKNEKSLIVVTNGALGLLPLSLLPTAPVTIKEGQPAFAAYRDVPWLARTHAVTMVPSAAALRTLRALPPGSPSRSNLVAFGDPYFSEKQAQDAQRGEEKVVIASADGIATRGVPLKRRSSPQTQGVNSADLAQLPRLPDTAEELKSIALALEADPAKTLHLGKDANEKVVKTADLSNVKVLAFATHGLVPGDLDGLTQPALALTAPQVADIDGDGLLTMEEILTLKLDADWVVLSACNTGAGAGAGAEAASGLGRAFFYAGTRAILVTNWSVHSQSARELVTDLFRRQSADPKLSRGEALRQAMVALIDGKGFIDDKGATIFSYAHPLFWAPYTIIGDGG